MNTKQTNIILFGLLALTILVGFYVEPRLPDQIVSHWNAEGVPDDYMTKGESMVFFPLMLVVLMVIYAAIPLIDPLKKNIASFRPAYNLFWLLISGFLFYIFSLSTAWNLGYRFNFVLFVIPAIAILWYVIGALLTKAKRNWFVGIRTPWTLSSDTVWDKTHALGGKLFKGAAVVALLGMFASDFEIAYIFVIVPVMIIAVITILYSFLAFKKEEKLKEPGV